jgi:endonuclease III
MARAPTQKPAEKKKTPPKTPPSQVAKKAAKAIGQRAKKAVAKVAAKAKAKPAKKPPARKRADWDAIALRLAKAIPDAVCELRFERPFELLIATILSAQSTDRTVNAVLPSLMARFPTPKALAESDQEEVEELIKRTGFFRNKAKAIRGTAAKLVAEHGGEVPRDLDALVALPGVARKTANVVLGTAFRIPSGFVVDTHVTRVSQRLALTDATDPVRIEQDLCGGFPKDAWIDLGHRFVLHGRYTCVARTPMCSECALNELCPSRTQRPEDEWEARAKREAKRVNDALD